MLLRINSNDSNWILSVVTTLDLSLLCTQEQQHQHNPNMLQLNLVVDQGEASRLPSRERWQRWNKPHPLLFL